jgi:hypothetical protein
MALIGLLGSCCSDGAVLLSGLLAAFVDGRTGVGAGCRAPRRVERDAVARVETRFFN